MNKNKYLHKSYVKPGKVFGNVYFVGLRSASTHLIDTGDGLILLDPGFPETLWIVLDNIRQLGFDEKSIRIILMSHGHYDHAGATRDLVRLTGAKTYIGRGDLDMVTGKEDTSWADVFNTQFTQTFTPDVILSDGDVISLGNTRILCLETPGHTDGTMSFFFDCTDGTNTFRAGMHGGVGTNTLSREACQKYSLPLTNREVYKNSIARVMDQKVEIFLGNHVHNNDTEGKLQKVADGDPLAFYAPEEWKPFLNSCLKKLDRQIREEEREEATLRSILENKMIVIVRGVERENLVPFADAICRGGVTLLECTFDASGKIPDEEIADQIRMLNEALGDRMMIGSGTVLTEKQVLLSKKAGAKFIISPDSNPEVIRLTKKHRMISIPGALTPSEITQAHRAGADFIKLFPSRSMGAGYLKDLAAPLSHVRFLAVGGVNMDNMEEYWNSGACGFGIGSYIVDKEQIRQGNFETIEKRAREYVDRIAKLPKR